MSETLYRHYRRGTCYRIVGEARVQVVSEHPMRDDETVCLYQDVNTGAYYIRRHSEFHDGRFEAFVHTEAQNDG